LKRILVIENDIDTLEMVGFLLGDRGFEVIQLVNKISIRDIIVLNPDLVIIDYLLGDGYGDELCLEIKSNPLTNQIPVILFSASHHLEQIAKDCGANTYITKPFDISYFEEKVKELVCH
jgi:DNA-binding response OmpR family regulator